MKLLGMHRIPVLIRPDLRLIKKSDIGIRPDFLLKILMYSKNLKKRDVKKD
jgi:hypothetical protein